MPRELLEHTDESGTREHILRLIVERGPVTAAALAEQLDLTSAAVRRHLLALEEGEQIVARADATSAKRGRGRPARHYVASAAAHTHLDTAYAEAALAALEQLREAAGESAILAYAEQRGDQMRRDYADAVEAAGDDIAARAQALADLLSEAGYAATARPMGGGVAVQICQGHCPVQRVAAAHPELCEAETRAFSDLLDVHVQRLATLAAGDHVCTTHIPVMIPRKDSA